MTLREKVQKLLEVPALPSRERTLLHSVLFMAPKDQALEEVMYPAVRAHVEGRYEWFFKPNGERRGAA